MTPADERAAVRALQVFTRRCDLVVVTDAALARVAPPSPVEPIRTLDAVHLAPAEQLGEPPALVTIIARDKRSRERARARLSGRVAACAGLALVSLGSMSARASR